MIDGLYNADLIGIGGHGSLCQLLCTSTEMLWEVSFV
jgi:hypothetical protein